ncbi:MAG TPA: 3'-5' exonuclease [Hydrogenophaga sp.]|uniref:3'-5' exonuclease n=1 Tax=Hydrogenophaga sp. TaxID=1904254 RepID=UPI002CBED81B|nr:3'-5' exonuclease [Hydrogenophaga sp.]HMN94467.1 3'-5' exonuclease [Hydrogenophaga sp.]HMP11163.1 3'-5' exonuclease [Hydrogenophaga sp.]
MTPRPHRHTPDRDEITALPAFERLGLEHIVRVDDEGGARTAALALAAHPVWGFDTESKPTFVRDQASDGPHVVQLATAQQAWVFQLHDPGCRALVAAMLADPGHVKAGFGLGDDHKRIVAKLGVQPAGVLDLNHVFRRLGYRKDIGVKAAVAVMFGQSFAKSKKAATSNWAARQLSPGQLVYAANDAWAAARVHGALVASGQIS